MSDPRAERFAQWVEASTPFTNVRLAGIIGGGNSNVTRLVETAQGKLVLRHPPEQAISDKAAAGIEREYTALKALAGHARVAEPVAWCSDASIIGQPFSLTRFVEGAALTDRLPAAVPGGTDSVDALGLSMARALGEAHRVDPRPLLDQGFGRPDGFVERQIDRWSRIRSSEAVRDLPLVAQIAGWLSANVPEPAAAAIVHCDFHLDNCLTALDRPEVVAIIDWEMATVADPRIDLGLMLFFWARDPGSTLGFPAIQALSCRPGVVAREKLADAWAERAGRDSGQLAYFIVFSAWRLAAIVEGAYVLHRSGAIDSPYARALERDVPALLEEAAAAIDREAGL